MKSEISINLFKIHDWVKGHGNPIAGRMVEENPPALRATSLDNGGTDLAHLHKAGGVLHLI
jgi:hypothetical protein